MGDSFDKWVDKAGKVAGEAIRATGDLVNKGYDKAEKVAMQNKLSKLYRQLGALVYALEKNNEENDAMIGWYIGEIDRLKQKMAGPPTSAPADMHVYGDEDDAPGEEKDAMFCGDGEQ